MKIMNKSFFILLVFLISVTLIAPQIAFGQNTVRIGGSQPLTGGMAPAGKSGKIGYELAVEYLNKVKGGIYVAEAKKKLPAELILYDDASDPTKVKSLFERLINVDKIVAGLAPFSSYLTIAATVVTEQNQVPIISYAAWGDTIYNRGFKYCFNALIRASQEGKMTMDLIREINKTLPSPIKTIAILYEDTAYLAALAEGMKNNLGDLKSVYFEKFPPDTKDFSSLIFRLKELNPDFVAMNGNFTETIEFVRELKQYDANLKAVYMPYAADEEVYRNTLGKTTEFTWGHSHDLNINYGGEAGKVLSWLRNKQKEMKLPSWPEDQATHGAFDSVVIFADAIERAGKLDPKKIRDAMAATDSTFTMGPVKFDSTGVNTKRSIGIVQVQGGKWVLIAPWEFGGRKIEVGKVKYPMPKWEK